MHEGAGRLFRPLVFDVLRQPVSTDGIERTKIVLRLLGEQDQEHECGNDQAGENFPRHGAHSTGGIYDAILRDADVGADTFI